MAWQSWFDFGEDEAGKLRDEPKLVHSQTLPNSDFVHQLTRGPNGVFYGSVLRETVVWVPASKPTSWTTPYDVREALRFRTDFARSEDATQERVVVSCKGLIATGGTDGIVRLWQIGLATEREPPVLSACLVEALRGHTSEVTDLCFDPSGRKVRLYNTHHHKGCAVSC